VNAEKTTSTEAAVTTSSGQAVLKSDPEKPGKDGDNG
jgi:hypothetical protein